MTATARIDAPAARRLTLISVLPNPRPVESPSVPWQERRAAQRTIVGGCPDHWWSPGARTTAACTCDR